MQTSKFSPAEQLQKDIQSSQSELRQLVEQTKLTSVRNAASQLDTDIANLPVRIRKIRDRKYAFNKILETQAVEFQKQWVQTGRRVRNQVSIESTRLQNLLRPLETRVSVSRTGPNAAGNVARVRTEMDAFKSKINTAERALNEIFDGIKREVSQVKNQLDRIEKTLDHFESASFGFLPTESVVIATKAVWTRDQNEDKGDPEGILFLTDQRLIFEQKEEIATKKVLFVTTERKVVQQIQFELPVFSVANVKATKQGVFKNEDWLDLEFDHGAFARSARLHLDGQDCLLWQKLITQAKVHELDDDRALVIDKVAVELAKSAPEICPYCGGAITKPVLRGMDAISCDFCGNKIKLSIT